MWTVYIPGSRSGATYSPAWPVSRVRVRPRSMSITSTLAPTTAPSRLIRNRPRDSPGATLSVYLLAENQRREGKNRKAQKDRYSLVCGGNSDDCKVHGNSVNCAGLVSIDHRALPPFRRTIER